MAWKCNTENCKQDRFITSQKIYSDGGKMLSFGEKMHEAKSMVKFDARALPSDTTVMCTFCLSCRQPAFWLDNGVEQTPSLFTHGEIKIKGARQEDSEIITALLLGINESRLMTTWSPDDDAEQRDPDHVEMLREMYNIGRNIGVALQGFDPE